VTAFQRPPRSGKWVAKFELRHEQHWVPGGPWSTKSAAKAAEQRYRDKLNARCSSETCASFADRWLEEWPRRALSTQRNYRDAVKRFADHFGPTPLGDVERLSARTWALSVPRGVSRVVGIMYEDARNVGLVEGNPFSNLRLPLVERTDIHPPTLEEYRALLRACTVLGGYGPEFRAMIQFSAWTGIRAGELQALRLSDVDTDQIHVRHSRRRDGSLGPPKNGKAESMPFPPPARVLDQVPRRPDDFVFHSPRGLPLQQGSHHYSWRTVRARAGVRETIRWHDLRHFCATQLLELGADHFAVSVQLRHHDGGKLVMERYGHPSREAAKDRLLALFSLDSEATGSAGHSRTATNRMGRGS
jgi:integrase